MTDADVAITRAADPSTPLAELAQLAYEHPEVRAVVAANPSAYDDLLRWLGQLGDAGVDAALLTRARAEGAPTVGDDLAEPDGSLAGASPSERTSAGGSLATGVKSQSWWVRPRASLYTSTAVGALALAIVTAIALSTAARVADLESQRGEVIAMPLIEQSPPTPTPAPTVTTPPPASIIPSTCGDLYSASMVAAIEGAGFHLGTAARLHSPAGTADAQLANLMGDSQRLECTWHPLDGNPIGLETSVLEVNAATSAAVMARLQALGYAPLNELGGVRYVIERVRADGTAYGESHMLRDGVWFATEWLHYGPYGYSANMVAQVFG